MGIELWTPNDIYMLREDPRMNPIPSWILDTFFNLTYASGKDEIRFADLPEADRFLAPFVLPFEQGKPMDRRNGETIKSFAPPYIKLKNAVRAEESKNILPSEVFRTRGRPLTIAEQFDRRVVELTEMQLRAIRMREAWMAARAFIDGKVQIDYSRDQGAASPSVLLDFGRDAGHTVVKTDDYWDDPATSILSDVESWMNTMYLANGGGSANMLLVGAKVAPLFRKNTEVKASLDTNYRGNNSVVMDLGILRTEQPLTYIGQLGTGLEVWSYKDTVDIPDGSGGKTKIDLFNEKDVLLVAPGATGVRAYGGIFDDAAIAAGMTDADIFGKMFTTDDPGQTFIMHQSSPLPIPLYPNRTFKARVLA